MTNACRECGDLFEEYEVEAGYQEPGGTYWDEAGAPGGPLCEPCFWRFHQLAWEIRGQEQILETRE